MLIVGGDRDFKFSMQVDSRKSLPKDDKTFLKRAWSGQANLISERLKLEWSNFVHGYAM